MSSKLGVGSPPFTRQDSRGKKPRPLHGMDLWIAFGAILYACITPMSVQAESEKGEQEMTVSAGTKVSIEYTLKLEDKKVLDSNVGSDPLTYVHGSHQIIPGLENALEGMKIGDSKNVTVKPEDGYGTVNEEAIVEVKKEQLPQDALKEGTELQGRDANGRAIYARVVEVKEQTVVVDFNHPLAGRTLYFDVKILDIQRTSAK